MNTDEENAAAAALAALNLTENGYLVEQSTRPETIGYALLDSPVALAVWMLDHETDSYYKISRALWGTTVGQPHPRAHPRQRHALLADRHRRLRARSYWESFQAPTGRGPGRAVPVAFSAFPSEIFKAPSSWIRHDYPTLRYHNNPDRGWHFTSGSSWPSESIT
jgi:hypothetical protein